MNLYLFEYQYEDGARWEIVAVDLDNALQYFYKLHPTLSFELSRPLFNYQEGYENWVLTHTVHDGDLDISIIEKPIHYGVL